MSKMRRRLTMNYLAADIYEVRIYRAATCTGGPEGSVYSNFKLMESLHLDLKAVDHITEHCSVSMSLWSGGSVVAVLDYTDTEGAGAACAQLLNHWLVVAQGGTGLPEGYAEVVGEERTEETSTPTSRNSRAGGQLLRGEL